MEDYEENTVVENHRETSLFVFSKNERTILPDLRGYPFDDDIKNQADIIYNKMIYRVRRGKIRIQMLYYCVYNAHLVLGRNVTPTSVGSKFSLTQGEIQRCNSIFSALQTGYKPPSIQTSPLAYFPEFCEKMELSERALEELISLASSILSKNTDFWQDNPQTVAAGLLKYYADINGIVLTDPSLLSKVTGRSNVTIESIYRRIAIVDNS